MVCPDADAQDAAFHALRRHPDVAIRVTPALEPKVGPEADAVDTCLDQDPEEDDGVGLVFFDDDEEEGDQDEDGDEGEFLR